MGYVYAPVPEGQFIYVKLPPEDTLPGEEKLCGRLDYSMYGTRRAATNWQAHYTKALTKRGFTVGMANNCTFYHPRYNIYFMVHSGDFVSTGPAKSLKWLEETLTK